MYKIIAIISVTLCAVYNNECLAEDTFCGDWQAYKDEKCFKIYDETTVTFDDAIKTCSQQDKSGSLAIIDSKDEQDFIANFVFNTKKVADNVWIGIRNSSFKFTKINNVDLSYTNWSPGSPQNESDYNCVQMIADKNLAGKWINEPCVRKNVVICEKFQVWSFAHLQKIVMEERNQMRDEISKIKQNPVPLDFIYVQLPGQNEPKLVWPTVNWTDVSSAYAGLFFRVLGGSSESFELEQSENDRYLQSVQFDSSGYSGLVDVPLNGQWSTNVYSGDYSGNTHYSHQFKLSVGEVRPRNKAVKVWKRTA